MLRVLLAAAALLFLVVVAGPVLLGWGTDPVGFGVWWLTNTAPPPVHIEGPGSVVRGVTQLRIVTPDPDRARVVEFRIDGAPVPADWTINLDTQTLPDGQHQAQVIVRDRSWRQNEASAELAFQTDNTPPELRLELEPAAPTAGRTLVIRVRTDPDASVSGEIDGQVLPIQPGSEFRWAVVGFSPESATRSTNLTFTASDAAGNVATASQSYTVLPTEYPTEKVELPAEFEPILDPEVRAREDALLAEIYKKVSGPPRWRGLFARPAPGEVTTVFGIARTYNRHTYVVHHSGTDFAAGEGDPIHAANDGVVVYTGTLELRGNVVVIDHGAGVYSTYAHLSEALVQPGDEVKKGEVVARVGHTGLSTGPHLHWEIWALGANVDPLDWTEHEIP